MMLYSMQMKNSTYCIKKDSGDVKEKLVQRQGVRI